jgi:cobalt transporter subunit CbtA
MLRETLLASLLAGLCAAVVLTCLQSVWVTPLILRGEVYEDAVAQQTSSPASSDVHHHEAEEWKPRDGMERTLYTAAADLLLAVGYAFVLISTYLLWRAPRTPLWGAAFGLAGFTVFFAAPALGLPPQLPGTAAAELSVRQEWWAMTAAATAAGLLMLFSSPQLRVRLLAIAILIAPHLVPAPQPVKPGSLAPEDLQSQFRLATTVCNAIFWVALGIASSVAFRKLVRRHS